MRICLWNHITTRFVEEDDMLGGLSIGRAIECRFLPWSSDDISWHEDMPEWFYKLIINEHDLLFDKCSDCTSTQSLRGLQIGH